MFGSAVTIEETYPTETVKVVEDANRSNYSSKEIHIDDTLIHFLNLDDDTVNTPLAANFDVQDSEIGSEEIVIDEFLRINFHRTVRLPDDDKVHMLPQSLGSYRLFNPSSFSARLPEHIARAGGVMFPMWQREAMWIEFKCNSNCDRYYAIRINVGRINAITGLPMTEKSESQDYVS